MPARGRPELTRRSAGLPRIGMARPPSSGWPGLGGNGSGRAAAGPGFPYRETEPRENNSRGPCHGQHFGGCRGRGRLPDQAWALLSRARRAPCRKRGEITQLFTLRQWETAASHPRGERNLCREGAWPCTSCLVSQCPAREKLGLCVSPPCHRIQTRGCHLPAGCVISKFTVTLVLPAAVSSLFLGTSLLKRQAVTAYSVPPAFPHPTLSAS